MLAYEEAEDLVGHLRKARRTESEPKCQPSAQPSQLISDVQPRCLEWGRKDSKPGKCRGKRWGRLGEDSLTCSCDAPRATDRAPCPGSEKAIV